MALHCPTYSAWCKRASLPTGLPMAAKHLYSYMERSVVRCHLVATANSFCNETLFQINKPNENVQVSKFDMQTLQKASFWSTACRPSSVLQRTAPQTIAMTPGMRPPVEGLHSELIACVLAHLKFNKDKIRLKAVCSIWRDALQLPAAHPPESFGSCGWPEDIVADYQLLGGSERVESLYVGSSYFRKFHATLSLTNLRSLHLEAKDDHETVHLPHMPNLQRLSLTTADQSGHQLLQTGLLELTALTALCYTSDHEGDEDIPTICAPSRCDMEVRMIDACLRFIPVATSKNLTKLTVSLNTNTFPDLRNCDRLTCIQFWLDKLHVPGPQPICLQGMNNLPGTVEFVRFVSQGGALSVEDRHGYCQFRGEHGMFGWCTYILSTDKAEEVEDLCTYTELFDF